MSDNGKIIGRTIKELHDLEQEVTKLTTAIGEKRVVIQDYFDKNNLKTLEVSSPRNPNLTFVAKKSERVTLDYDVDKLKKALDPEVFNEVVDKVYIVTDMNKLISLVKSAGIPAKEFKELIVTNIVVNKSEIKRLYDEKEITLKDLKGCYTAKVSKSIKVVERTGDSD